MHSLGRWAIRLLLLAYPRAFRREWGRAFEEDAVALLRRCRTRWGAVPGLLRGVSLLLADTVRGAALAWGVADRPGPASASTRRGGRLGLERTMGWMDDLRIALRSVSRRPALGATVALTMALGLAANTTIFGILDRVVLTPMRFEGGDRVVFLAIRDAVRGWQFAPSQQHLELWRERSTTLEAVEVFRPAQFRVAREGLEEIRVDGASVSVGMLAMTSRPPVLGRGFVEEDAAPGAPPVVMLDESWWRSEFGADPEVVGTTVRIQDEVAVVIGVWPEEVRPSLRQDPRVWRVLPRGLELERTVWSNVIGMRAAGVDGAGVAAELVALGTPDDADAPAGEPVVEPITAFLSATFVESIWLLFWGTLLLGVVAALNAANLLLERSDARAGELGVRAALGGSRARLLRVFAAEAILLSLGGVLVGSLLSLVAASVLIDLIPSDVPILDARILLTGRVALWGGLFTLALVAVCTLVPATRLRRSEIHALLTEGGANRRLAPRSSTLRSTLVAAQIALAVLLVTGASLTFRSWRSLISVDPGWRITETVMVGLRLPEQRYPTPDDRAAFWSRLVERLEGLPDVEGVTSIGNPFFQAGLAGPIPVPSDWEGPPLDESEYATTEFGLANHFEVLGVPVRGEVRPGVDGERTIVVNDAYVRRFGPVLGRVIAPPGDSIGYVVTGVAGNVRVWSLKDGVDRIHLFYPEDRLENASHRIVVRSTHPHLSLGMIQSAIAELDPALRPGELAAGSTMLAAQSSLERFSALLLAVLGGSTLLLAGAGVYAVVALAVRRRTREMGLRMALGASGGSVVRSVIRQGMVPVIVGTGLGLVASALAGSRLEQILFEVSERDPVSLGVGVALLLLVGLAAAWVPARTATRVDPVEALRAD